MYIHSTLYHFKSIQASHLKLQAHIHRVLFNRLAKCHSPIFKTVRVIREIRAIVISLFLTTRCPQFTDILSISSRPFQFLYRQNTNHTSTIQLRNTRGNERISPPHLPSNTCALLNYLLAAFERENNSLSFNENDSRVILIHQRVPTMEFPPQTYPIPGNPQETPSATSRTTLYIPHEITNPLKGHPRELLPSHKPISLQQRHIWNLKQPREHLAVDTGCTAKHGLIQLISTFLSYSTPSSTPICFLPRRNSSRIDEITAIFNFFLFSNILLVFREHLFSSKYLPMFDQSQFRQFSCDLSLVFCVMIANSLAFHFQQFIQQSCDVRATTTNRERIS